MGLRSRTAPLVVIMASWGFVSGINGSIAPFLAGSFGLGDAEIAHLLAWIGLASPVALVLGRQVDRIGRRRMLLACFAVLPCAAAASALAPSPVLYLLAQLVAYAVGGTLLATVTVVVTEELPTGERARGQSRVGAAFALATALPLALAALLSGPAEGWRRVWWVATLAILALPWLRRRLAETSRFTRAAARGGRATRMLDVFQAPTRRRALPVLGCALLVYGVEFSARTWLFYHPVRTLGLDPRRAGVVLLVCGGLGLVGFRLGGWLSDRWGRRGAFAASSGLFALSSAGYYGLSSHAGAWTVPVLGLSLLGLSTGGNAAVVAFRSLATELFPTRLRGTLAGWTAVCSALGWCGAMLATSWLSDALGGIGPAVTALILVALPAAALALAPLPETAGLDLEVAAMEG